MATKSAVGLCSSVYICAYVTTMKQSDKNFRFLWFTSCLVTTAALSLFLSDAPLNEVVIPVYNLTTWLIHTQMKQKGSTDLLALQYTSVSICGPAKVYLFIREVQIKINPEGFLLCSGHHDSTYLYIANSSLLKILYEKRWKI